MVSSRKRTLQIDILMDPSGLNRGVGQVQSASGQISGRISHIGAVTKAAIGVVAAGAVMRLGQQMAEQGARIEGIGVRIDTVFGSNAARVKQWAEANRAAFGMSTAGVLDLAGAFGDLLVPMGFTRSDAADLTTRLLKGANAFSEWTGGTVSASEAGNHLVKAMLGERDGIKQLGIALDQQAVDALLAERGQRDLTGAAREQAEAVATLDLIWRKGADALTAYDEGGNQALRTQRELASQTAQLKDELATELMPVFANVVDVSLSAAEGVRIIVKWFQDLPGPAKQAALAIGGIAAALWAFHAHPAVAGLALIAGAVTMLGAGARAEREQVARFTEALRELGEVKPPDLAGMLSTQTLALLNAAGITLNDVAAALGDTAAVNDIVAEAATHSSDIWAIQEATAHRLADELGPLNTAYRQLAEEAATTARTLQLAADQEQRSEQATRRLAAGQRDTAASFQASTRSADEWKSALEGARQRVVDLANAQLEAASPVLQVIRAQEAHAEAESRLTELQADRTTTSEQLTAAQLDVIETEGRLQGAQGLLVTQLGESTSAFRTLAEDAGFYGEQLERIIGLLWDYERAPKPGPSPYDAYDDDGRRRPQ